MPYWNLIYYCDLILFILVSLTVLYMAVFAVASLFSRHNRIPKSHAFFTTVLRPSPLNVNK